MGRHPRDHLPEFDWSDGNDDHIWEEHKVSVWQVESCFLDLNASRRRLNRTTLGMLAATDDRMLFIAYYFRRGKVRVRTARDMTDNEKRRYRKGRRQ